MTQVPHISVCICTYMRPRLLEDLLRNLNNQQTAGRFSYNVVVADNDGAQSARMSVETVRSQVAYKILYTVEPRKNIALARNAALRIAHGDYIAFIDDDEFAPDDWLFRMLETCIAYGADGAIGTVRPHFVCPPPLWITKSGICERPEYPTGTQLRWDQTRTGNALVKRSLFESEGSLFRPSFGVTFGEDLDFFRRMINLGHRFVFCREAPVFEHVVAARMNKSYFLRRAFLQGSANARHLQQHKSAVLVLRSAAKSTTSIVLYGALMPIFLARGLHVAMKFIMKSAYHFGRLLTLAGMRQPRARDL